jgi:DinB superfamily
MGPKDAIKLTLAASERVVSTYLNDLSDSDLLVVPIEGMNPIALQVGHLISSEHRMAGLVSPGKPPALPEGFAEYHSLKNPPADPSKYLSKDEYLRIWKAQRAVTESALETLADSELDDTRDGTLPPFAPTVAAVLNTIGVHPLMHAGQFVAVRRYLKKPIAF